MPNYPVRNSVKALIWKDGKLLAVRIAPKGKPFYVLPGGGQELAESFLETLHRECREELGAEVEIGELVLVREYIGRNHEFADTDYDYHQAEFMFDCKLLTPLGSLHEKNPDAAYQEGFFWVSPDDPELFPHILAKCFDQNGNRICPLYIGDVN